MFNVDQPCLVFSERCYTPYDNLPYGWGFDYYEYNMDRPQGLFFSDLAEVFFFAHARRAIVFMDEEARPDKVSALDYLLSRDDDSRFPVPPPDYRSKPKTSAQIRQGLMNLANSDTFPQARLTELLAEYEDKADETVDSGFDDGRYGVDWVGSGTSYHGGRVPTHLDSEPIVAREDLRDLER